MLSHKCHTVEASPALVLSLDLGLGLTLKVLLVLLESVPGSVKVRVVPHLGVEVGGNIAVEGDVAYSTTV